MAFFYPRKQTVIISLISIFAVAGAFLYANGTIETDNRPKRDVEITGDTQAKENADGITNNKGADYDWKKEFVNSTTTEQSFKMVSGTRAKTKTAQSVPDTDTDKLGRSFFEKYVELRQAGLNGDSDSIKNAMSEVIVNTFEQLPSPKFYTIDNLNISTLAENQPVLQSYADRLFTLLRNKLPSPDNNEMLIAVNAFEDNNMDKLSEIDKIISGYKTVKDSLIAMPVTRGLSSYHLNLLNAVSLGLYNAESIRKIDTDPIRSLAGINLELAGLQSLNDSIANIQNYLITSGIKYINIKP